MKESNILAGNVVNNFLIWFNIKGQYMKESNILVENATINQPQREVWLDTKGEYMKESNILVGNVTIKQLQRVVLLNTRGECLKESNMIVYNNDQVPKLRTMRLFASNSVDNLYSLASTISASK